MVEMCKKADADGCFFGEPVAPWLLQYTHLYTDEQRAQIHAAGFSVSPSTKDGRGGGDGDGDDDSADDDKGGGNGGNGGSADRSLQFWGARGKRRLLARLRHFAGPEREFALRKPRSRTLEKRRRLTGTVVFSCKRCRIWHQCPLSRLTLASLPQDTFKCLCSSGFTFRDALSRRANTSWRNLRVFIDSKLPNTELVTTHETFAADRSSVVLRCTHCRNEKRVQPRDVFGPDAACAACAACA